MKKIIWYLITLIIIFCIIWCIRHLFFLGTKRICATNHCFSIEIADTPASRQVGLMNRTGMADNHGMLFVFAQPDIHDFWMKNTLIPLDMIRMDSGYTVLEIQSAVPCTTAICPIYHPNFPSSYVLELAGGIAKKIGLKKGSKLKMK